MDVFTDTDRGDDTANIGSVFDCGIAIRQIGEGNFVADRDIVFGRQPKIAVVLGYDTEQLRTCLDTFDDDNADIIFLIVD
jgi:hypothetical protein